MVLLVLPRRYFYRFHRYLPVVSPPRWRATDAATASTRMEPRQTGAKISAPHEKISAPHKKISARFSLVESEEERVQQ